MSGVFHLGNGSANCPTSSWLRTMCVAWPNYHSNTQMLSISDNAGVWKLYLSVLRIPRACAGLDRLALQDEHELGSCQGSAGVWGLGFRPAAFPQPESTLVTAGIQGEGQKLNEHVT